ncbi:hypothetical protein ACFQ0X_42900 [Streptomyces rectiviolaceus]|uniref:Uncharacterized protein n=1 Tax=Streptomyces rectiviolaceus TaxID=332591 RepID=A0ABP6MI54_9ACTN
MTWSNVTDLEPGDVISIPGVNHVFNDDVMRTGGSIAWNDRNPGNIISSGEAVSIGAYPGKHHDILAFFADDETGFHGSHDPQRYAQQVADAIRRVEGWRPDPDDLYVTTTGNGSTGSANSGQTQPLGVNVPVDFVQDLFLRDYDSASVSSPVEGSAYYVTYLVD